MKRKGKGEEGKKGADRRHAIAGGEHEGLVYELCTSYFVRISFLLLCLFCLCNSFSSDDWGLVQGSGWQSRRRLSMHSVDPVRMVLADYSACCGHGLSFPSGTHFPAAENE